MPRTSGHRLLCASLVSTLLALASPFAHAQWTVPTPEELSMTSQPEVPGAAAVYLFREEIKDDALHETTIYRRLKVLNEGGKEYADVEIPSYASSVANIEGIEGRTVHPDGTISLFKGKLYRKPNPRNPDGHSFVNVITMPDVEVGSIIEYRYRMHSVGSLLLLPQWYLQSDLWTRSIHFFWNSIQTSEKILWNSILPDGVELRKSSQNSPTGERTIFELTAHDISPLPKENYLPPVYSFSPQVLFFYSHYTSEDEFWKGEGAIWAKSHDKFIGPGSNVIAAAKGLISASDTEEQKLRKIYAAVMQLENVSFTRVTPTAEEKAQEARDVHTTDDVWTRKRGSNVQLTELFVAMARAAGMKAYFASVTDRNRKTFKKAFLNVSQLDGPLAIVNVDGKEQFFDPGALYCPYGHLVWQQTQASGFRQTEHGTDLFRTPPESYTYSHTQRVANLVIDQQGNVTGTIKMTYTGEPSLIWRQRTITGDVASMKQALSTSVEHLVPKGMEVKLSSIDNLADYEQPLVANFEVKGHLGSSTGKRVLIPGDLFEASSIPKFPQEKREFPVLFSYPYIVQDAIRIDFPATLSVASLPARDATKFRTFAGYDMTITSTPTSFTTRRNFILGEILYPLNEYPDLRSFYSRMETKDQESVVLTTASGQAPGGN